MPPGSDYALLVQLVTIYGWTPVNGTRKQKAKTMKNVFKDILAEPSVEGVLFCSLDGGKVFSAGINHTGGQGGPSHSLFLGLLRHPAFKKMKEMELIFSQKKMYLKYLPDGILCVIMDLAASMPMVRLTCDTIQLQMQEAPMKKGFKRFFTA